MNLFPDLIGQQQAIGLLTAAIARNRIAPAYLFSGTSGVGKSIVAKYFSRLLLTGSPQISAENHPDLFWVEPSCIQKGQLLTKKQAIEAGIASKVGFIVRIEQIREIVNFIGRPPFKASRSLVIIEDAETMTEGAANALLKTLEEPGKATIILIASSHDSLLPTLISRCQRIPFYGLSTVEIGEVLQQIDRQEILDYPEVLAIAQGSPGKAIEAFRQLQNISQDLLQKLKQPINNPLQAFAIAKEIDKQLDTQAQLWLVDYLQYFYWQHLQAKKAIEQLEKTRQYLLCYVQSRLVWETTLLYLAAERN
jgi:DNA polymerase III subunit delta'